MAGDAEIRRIDSILELSNTIVKGQELICQECLAIGKMVMDKLAELQKKKAQAEMIYREISGQVAAKRHYYAANNKFPTSVSAGGKTFTIPEFLYLMSQAI